MAQQQRSKRTQKEVMPFRRQNLYILLIGLAVIVAGYIMMARPPVNGFWTLTAAPVVLMIAFLIIIPYAIFHGWKKPKREGSDSQEPRQD
jgi:uncharacterized membrane protein HdeD (DUF308 family)